MIDNETRKCSHWECPYRYCNFHEDYDKDEEFVIPVPEGNPNECMAYLDV